MSYSDVKQEIDLMRGSVNVLDNLITDPSMDVNLDNIEQSLNAIYAWAESKEQGELLNSFLTDLKALFTNYSATLSIVQGTVYYGESYGEAADKLKFVISKDGVSAEKVFDKDSINQEDI